MRSYEIGLSFSKLTIEITDVGQDRAVLVYGGEKPHIGSTVMAFPRPSLTGDGSISATSSVLNAVGHKDEAICRMIAEAIAARENCIVVCTGGFHIDGITPDQIRELMGKLKDFVQ